VFADGGALSLHRRRDEPWLRRPDHVVYLHLGRYLEFLYVLSLVEFS
jgi:hypothetical protein